MTSDNNVIETEALLANTTWVRSLARALLPDEHLAEDLVQETWLASLGFGPRSPGLLRPWLRSVVHNIAHNVRRSESTRRPPSRARRDGDAPRD